MSLIKHTIKYSDGSIYRGYVNEAKQPHIAEDEHDGMKYIRSL